MTTTVTLMGAGGKMGCRITEMVKDDDAYEMRYVEPSEAGQDRLADLGVSTTAPEDALADTDVVVMAVPDELMGAIAADVAPQLPSGAMIVLLDPAAAYAGVLPEREDITYFITHPCHPPLFNDETDPAAQTDWFGGQGKAKQNIACALHQGPESDYELGEQIARDIYAPVMTAHRMTTEQMAILEPALAETLSATCLTVVREGMEKAVERGVPEAAARDFLFGHLRIEMAIIFGEAGFPFSDGAQRAIEQAKPEIFREDWDSVLAIDNVRESVADIASAD